MTGAVAVLGALARNWPLIVAGWFLGMTVVVAFVYRAGRVLNRDPQFWRCVGCQAVFLRPGDLAGHIEAQHPALMPRVDA